MTGKGDMETGKVAAKGGNGGERGKQRQKATGKVEKMGKGGMTGKGIPPFNQKIIQFLLEEYPI